ncbi:hypothetical protein BHE74_00038031 [Ensete ventricosum]|nr:hypothetical protein BHE74_00038031 [Ensete ventricosum]
MSAYGQGCNLSSVREGRDLQALAADERDGGFVSAEEAVRGDEGEQHITRHRREGDANRGCRPLAEAAVDTALFAPRYLYVPLVCQVHYLGRHRSGCQDCVSWHGDVERREEGVRRANSIGVHQIPVLGRHETKACYSPQPWKEGRGEGDLALLEGGEVGVGDGAIVVVLRVLEHDDQRRQAEPHGRHSQQSLRRPPVPTVGPSARGGLLPVQRHRGHSSRLLVLLPLLFAYRLHHPQSCAGEEGAAEGEGRRSVSV